MQRNLDESIMCFYRIDSVLRTCSDKRNWNYLITVNLNAELKGARPVINVTAAHCAFSAEHRASAALARYAVTNRVVVWREQTSCCWNLRQVSEATISNRLRSKYFDTRQSGSFTWFSEIRATSYEGPLSKHGEDPPRQSLIYFPFSWCDDGRRVLQK